MSGWRRKWNDERRVVTGLTTEAAVVTAAPLYFSAAFRP